MKTDCNLDINKYLSECDRRDIISLESRNPMYLSKLYSLVKASFDNNLINHISNVITRKLEGKCDAKKWFVDGEECEILKAGSTGWQKGKLKLKIKLSLEFITDEPKEATSPLDDVRQEINKTVI